MFIGLFPCSQIVPLFIGGSLVHRWFNDCDCPTNGPVFCLRFACFTHNTSLFRNGSVLASDSLVYVMLGSKESPNVCVTKFCVCVHFRDRLIAKLGK